MDKPETTDRMPSIRIHPAGVMRFTYTNWRGETSVRRVTASSIQFSPTRWHLESQWVMHAIDLEKNNEPRYFAIRDMRDVTYED